MAMKGQEDRNRTEQDRAAQELEREGLAHASGMDEDAILADKKDTRERDKRHTQEGYGQQALMGDDGGLLEKTGYRGGSAEQSAMAQKAALDAASGKKGKKKDDFYFHLLLQQIDDLNNQIAALIDEIAQLRRDIAQQERELSDLKDDLGLKPGESVQDAINRGALDPDDPRVQQALAKEKKLAKDKQELDMKEQELERLNDLKKEAEDVVNRVNSGDPAAKEEAKVLSQKIGEELAETKGDAAKTREITQSDEFITSAKVSSDVDDQALKDEMRANRGHDEQRVQKLGDFDDFGFDESPAFAMESPGAGPAFLEESGKEPRSTSLAKSLDDRNDPGEAEKAILSAQFAKASTGETAAPALPRQVEPEMRNNPPFGGAPGTTV